MQNRHLHALLNQTGNLPFKADLVAAFSSGRTTSSKELTLAETRELISHLESLAKRNRVERAFDEVSPGNRMRKKIFGLCREMGYIYGETAQDQKLNQAIVYGIVLRKGYLKKPLMEYSVAELAKLVSQFEQMVVKRDLTQAKREVEGLLKEMGFIVSD